MIILKENQSVIFETRIILMSYPIYPKGARPTIATHAQALDLFLQ